MRLIRFLLPAVILIGLQLPASASPRPDHYQGKPSATLDQAVANFREHNRQLATLLAKQPLSAADLHKVHELTYTLENALEKLREELAELAEVLEEVHVASETNDPATVQARGKAYLSTAQKVIP